jgi:hypothetical protein
VPRGNVLRRSPPSKLSSYFIALLHSTTSSGLTCVFPGLPTHRQSKPRRRKPRLRRSPSSKLSSGLIYLLHSNELSSADWHASRAARAQAKQAKKEKAKTEKQKAKIEKETTKAEEKATKEGVNGNLKAENGVELAAPL